MMARLPWEPALASRPAGVQVLFGLRDTIERLRDCMMSRWWGGYTHSQLAIGGGHSGARLHKLKGGLGSF